MEPPPERQSAPNSNSASRTTESAPGSSQVALSYRKTDSEGLSLDTLHMHVAEQEYRIKCVQNINTELEETVVQFRDQLCKDDSMDPALEDLLGNHLRGRQERTAEIEHFKKLNKNLRCDIEKRLSVMSEAEKRKKRSEFDLPDLLKSIRQRLVDLESNLDFDRVMFEVFRCKLILVMMLEKQSVARQKSSNT